jgi:murein DD-endopeptidase MepM/ murein hydrolase activator NlpD
LPPELRRRLDGLQRAAAAHRRALTVGVVAALGGFGITAFGIAPLAPDAADLPTRIVTEPVEAGSLDAQLDRLAAQPQPSLTRSDVTRVADTAEGLLARLGIVDAQASELLRTHPTARRVLSGRAGKMIHARSGPTGELAELVARFPVEAGGQAKTHFHRLEIRRDGAGWVVDTRVVALEPRIQLGSGTITSSLFAATEAARLPDAVAVQLAEIFATEIDFHRDLRRGDTFSVVYETLTADGEAVAWSDGVGRVLAAEFVNAGKSHHALWFGGAGPRGGYFGLDGRSKQGDFLASPMEFSRVTSGFAMRMHPLLRTWRQHRGVDYAAPVGTPVRSVGDGVVSFAGWQNGYGQTVQIDHGNGRDTLYAHLSRIVVKKGERVDQGQHVGNVGMTGWTTGPHLHFEFRVGGVHKDPLQIAKASEPIVLDNTVRARFDESARLMQAKLDLAEGVAAPRTRFE